MRQAIASGMRGGGLFRGELRQALRALRRTPWYSVTVVGVIALGIALATTVFAMVDGVLFKPLPYQNAHELYVVDPPSGVASLRHVEEWAAALPDARVAAFQRVWHFDGGALSGTPPVRLAAAGVGAGFFDAIGARPLFGGFSAQDFDPPAGPLPALISYRLWRRVFDARTDVAGELLDVVGPRDHVGRVLAGYRVAGVLPRDFVYPDSERTPDLIVPMALTPDRAADRNSSVARALVRLPPPQDAGILKARLDPIAATQKFAASRRQTGVQVHRIDETVRTFEHTGFRTAFAMAAALCVLACINISALAVAWRRQRARDYALRAALGASRLQLARLLIAEVASVVVLGSLLGVVVAPAALATFARLVPPEIQLMKAPALDLRVLAFAAIAAAATVVLATIFQAGGLRARDLARTIGRADLGTTSRGLAARIGVVAQVAVAVIFLVGGSLVVGSYWLIWQQEIGYPVDATAVLEVHAGAGTRDEMAARSRAFVDRVRAIPGVERVGVLGAKLMEGWRLSPAIRRPAGLEEGDEQAMPIAGEFFEVLGIEPIAGRLPTVSEIERGAPVIVVSDRLSRRFWPNAPVVGQSLVSANGQATFTVIGVVPEARFARLDQSPGGQIYFTGALPGVVLIGARAPVNDVIRAAADAARGIGGGFGTTRALTLREAIGESIRARTFRAWLYGVFAAAALAIAAAGILGMVAMLTAGRTREIGIRRSLGATPATVAGMLFREQVAWIGAGLIAGAIGAAWAVQLVPRYFLFQFTAYDTRLWAIAIAIIAIVGVVGALIPSLRAGRVDPVAILRD